MPKRSGERGIKRYGQSFTQEDAEWLGAVFDMMARGGDLRVMREGPMFGKLYSQIVRLRARARADAEADAKPESVIVQP